MQRTQNYNLCQWAAEDRILRSDFNADNQKIDTALAGKARITVGSYTGTGEYGAEHPNTLTFDFAPKLFLLFPALAHQGQDFYAVPGIAQYNPCIVVWGATTLLGDGTGSNRITYSGNTISWWTNTGAQNQYNTSGQIYHYAAIG